MFKEYRKMGNFQVIEYVPYHEPLGMDSDEFVVSRKLWVIFNAPLLF